METVLDLIPIDLLGTMLKEHELYAILFEVSGELDPKIYRLLEMKDPEIIIATSKTVHLNFY